VTTSENRPPQSPAEAGNQAGLDARLEEWLGSTTGPLNWRSVPSGEAPERWESLREWVTWLRFEFNYDHRVVPPCWYEHRALVSVLAALHDHWTAAYDPLNGAGGASDWHRAFITLEGRSETGPQEPGAPRPSTDPTSSPNIPTTAKPGDATSSMTSTNAPNAK
jgi:hypothetical protein